VRIGSSMKSRMPAKSTISSNRASISSIVSPSASPPRMTLRSPERSRMSAAPTPSMLGRDDA
jgi:hypothetical protein